MKSPSTTRRAPFSLVKAAAAGATRRVTTYTTDRSRTLYVSTPAPEWVDDDPDDPSERSAGVRSGLLAARGRLSAPSRPNRSRTGTLRLMTDNVAALHAWRIR